MRRYATGSSIRYGNSDLVDLAFVIVEGEHLGKGAECAQFRLASGEQISLDGADMRQFAIGDRLQVTGHFVRISTCMQGRAFLVQKAGPSTALPGD